MYINVWMKMNAMLYLLCDWKKPMSNAHNKGMKTVSLEHSQLRNNEPARSNPYYRYCIDGNITATYYLHAQDAT